MMKTKVIACFLLAGFIFGSCKKEETPDLVNPPAEVTIVDPLLREQIRLKLGLAESEVINEENILRLDTLDLVGENDLTGAINGISSLEGLGAATELSYLRFGGTQVSDLTPIAGLRKVKYLRLNNTPVTSLAPLAQWTSLTYFNINSVTGITDISPIAGNTSLQEIIMRDVPFGNAGMPTFSNFNVLYRLNIRGTGITDIAVLITLMQNGALLDSTPGAAAAGGATLDLRGNTVDCALLDPYRSQINSLNGC
ncbi:MAG: hypothetical protein ACK417_05115 [Bacteroidia bacterium]